MNVALVHELLTMKGGAERVLRILASMFPHAPIYTLLYDEKKLGDWFAPQRVRIPHTIYHIPHAFNHHLYLSRFPRAVEAWDFSDYDLVISSSSAFVHGIITNGKPKHLCLVHSPARYLWDRTHDVLDRAGRGLLGIPRHWYLSHLFHRLRVWDAESAARPDRLLAASKEVQRRIELYWRRESTVLYPPIDDGWFLPQARMPALGKEKYFLVVSTLAPYKRIDLAIEACNRWKVPLKIAGQGPDERRLRSLAGPTIEFLGYQTDEALRDLYQHATATLFPGEEDFGLVPLESQACGTPVIAYRNGGALETIIDGETGVFFDEATAESLMGAMETFDRTRFDPQKCQEQARTFSREVFEGRLREEIGELMNE